MMNEIKKVQGNYPQISVEQYQKEKYEARKIEEDRIREIKRKQ